MRIKIFVMYRYEFDSDTGGIIITDKEEKLSMEPRPVYEQEMNVLGFNEFWKYDNQNDIPYMWAEAGKYFYRGKLIAKTIGGSLYEKPRLEVVEDGLPAGEKILPIDVDAMVKKNREAMSSLVQSTIKRVYNYWRRMRKRLDCFHVAFSGGKDSIVLLDIVKRALPHSAFMVVFGDTGMEFPDTYKIIDEVEERCKKDGINFYRAQSHLTPEESWKIFGPPSMTLRWCCSVHKSAPQILKIRQVLSKNDFVEASFVGVRGAESARRSEYEVENFGEKTKGQYSHNSIFEWNSAEIWNYIFMRRLPINETYKKGNSRAGCLFCPMTSGKAVFFRKNSYPDEVEKYVEIIKQTVNDENIESYIADERWVNRRNGRDLIKAVTNYSEEIRGDYLYITVKNPKTDWYEWIKTLGYTFFPYKVQTHLATGDITVKVHTQYDKTPAMKYFKSVFHKAAVCVGCGVCESNCRYSAISFKNGLHIENCRHCLECHKISNGCYIYDSARLPKNGDIKMEGINTFSDHAPKTEWLRDFFDEPEKFLETDGNLGSVQIVKFKRFLYDADLVDKKTKTVTDFARLIKKIGWNSADAWGLILINLAYNNPQIRWYIENMPIGVEFHKKTLEEKLIEINISKGNRRSVIGSFKRLCEIPLGRVLNFGEVTTNSRGQIDTLKRTAAVDYSGKVLLYALYKFAELCENYKQFTLTRMMDTEIRRYQKDDGSEVPILTPAQIFGVTREEMEQFLNGMTANYSEFINATFTFNLEKISLSEEKTSEDVLKLFEV